MECGQVTRRTTRTSAHGRGGTFISFFSCSSFLICFHTYTRLRTLLPKLRNLPTLERNLWMMLMLYSVFITLASSLVNSQSGKRRHSTACSKNTVTRLKEELPVLLSCDPKPNTSFVYYGIFTYQEMYHQVPTRFMILCPGFPVVSLTH